MLASLLIVFREVMEAGLIVGIVLAATQGIARRGAASSRAASPALRARRLRPCWPSFAGALSAIAVGQRVRRCLTPTILILAVLMLGWHNVWMASHGRELAREMKAMGRAVGAGETSLLAMAVVVGVAVLREGAEVVLFLYGIAASSQEGAAALILGRLLGVAGGAAVSWLLYRGLVAIPMKRLFAVTGWMIALLAAGMAGQAAAILAGADLIPAFGYQLWDTSSVLPESGIVGRALHALVGYSDRPMGVQVAAYLAVLALIAGLGRWAAPSRPPVRAAAAVHS